MPCKVVSSLALFTLFGLVTAENGWCNVKNCFTLNKGIHTLCKYPPGAAARCLVNGNLGGGLKDHEIQSILNLHNKLRQKVASGNEFRGSNGPQPRARFGQIPNLQWDYTLADIAQRWANQCNYGHDSCRDVSDYQVGQNVASSGISQDTSINDLLNMITRWYDEVQYFNRNEVQRFSGNLRTPYGNKIGHYTQMIWEKTVRIGCGLRNYYENGHNRCLFVCNYGPTGNFPNRPIYET